jgi:hypothetical protein
MSNRLGNVAPQKSRKPELCDPQRRASQHKGLRHVRRSPPQVAAAVDAEPMKRNPIDVNNMTDREFALLRARLT